MEFLFDAAELCLRGITMSPKPVAGFEAVDLRDFLALMIYFLEAAGA